VLSYVSAGFGIASIAEDMSNCHVPNVVFKCLESNLPAEVEFAFMYRTQEATPAGRVLIEAMRQHSLNR
jgi:DNA-binding transcriptional LysR family regulator